MTELTAGLVMGAAGVLGSLVCVGGLITAGALLLRADGRAAGLTFASAAAFLVSAVASPVAGVFASRAVSTSAMQAFTVVAVVRLALTVAGWLCLVSAMVILGRRVAAQQAPER